MKTLSLCMIVKDGEKYIEECIESVLPAVSEIIVVDTGSADRTLEKIKRFNPQIYHFEWNNNFAQARNFSLRHAKGEYTIILDADEIVYPQDCLALIKTIANTTADGISIKFHNLTDETNENIYNIHEGLRIFKTGAYHFEGAIHEQPVFNFSQRKPVIEYSAVRIKHYGYLKANSGKKKSDRNMAILKEVLAKNPNEPFHLFNMGNQFMSMDDYETALSYYEKADRLKDITLAYAPHLIFRHALCLQNLKRREECLDVIAKGLKTYPAFTDLEFLRGSVLSMMKRFTLALDSFNRCIQMGQAPPNQCFFPDTFKARAFIEIAEIYSCLDDHEKALGYYLKALKDDGKRYGLIYKIASSLNKIYQHKSMVYKNLCNLFLDSSYKPNIMVMADALLDEKLFEQAKLALYDYIKPDFNAGDADVFFLSGRILFYAKGYKEAFANFQAAAHPETKKGILPNTKNRAYEYMAACSLLCGECREYFRALVKFMEDSLEKSVYRAFLADSAEALDKKALKIISPVLSKLLPLREYDVFEKALDIMNLVEGNEALLSLAEVYFENNFPDMAVKTILRSVKELDSLNSKAVMILNKQL